LREATISELFEFAGVKATRTGSVLTWRQRFHYQSLILTNRNKCRALDSRTASSAGISKARHTGPPRKAAWQALIEAENGAYYTIGLNSLTGADLEAWPQKGGALRLGQKIIDTGFVLKVLDSQPPISARTDGVECELGASEIPPGELRLAVALIAHD